MVISCAGTKDGVRAILQYHTILKAHHLSFYSLLNPNIYHELCPTAKTSGSKIEASNVLHHVYPKKFSELEVNLRYPFPRSVIQLECVCERERAVLKYGSSIDTI